MQDALIRVHDATRSGEAIESPRAYVATVATRLAIDHLRSARVRREAYVGEWLPEPLLATDAADDPAARAELADSLSLAFLVLLESLSPEQRAAFLLREVFDYGYDEIAAIVGTSEANARQLATRARRHVEARRPRYEASAARSATRSPSGSSPPRSEGDLAALEELLAEDVVAARRRRRQGPRARAGAARPRPRRQDAARLVQARRPRGRGVPHHPTSTASPARSRSTRTGTRSASSRSTSPAGRSSGSARSSTRTSSPTSARWATCARCSRAQGADRDGHRARAARGRRRRSS